MQQGLHYALLANQKNNQIKGSAVYINKNIVDFCATKNAFVMFIRGNFYMTNAVDLILSEEQGLQPLEIFKVVNPKFKSGIAIIISHSSFESMVESFINQNSEVPLNPASIGTVEDLEDLIEGFSTAFNDNLPVQIESRIL